MSQPFRAQWQTVYHLRMIYLPKIHCALLAISNFWLLVYVYSWSGIKKIKIKLKKVWSLVWDGLSFLAGRLFSLTHVTPVCLSSLCLQQAAINKSCFAHYPGRVIGRCLWNWSALRTSSPETPRFCPSHLPGHHCPQLVSPPDPLFSVPLYSSFIIIPLVTSCHILMPLLDHIKFDLLCQKLKKTKITIFCGLHGTKTIEPHAF